VGPFTPPQEDAVSQFTDASPAEQHRVASDRLIAIAEQVTDWDAPTPVKEWRARDVPEHLAWVAGFLGGMGVSLDIPRVDAPAEQVRVLASAVQELLDSPAANEEVDSPMGRMPLAQVVNRFYTFDVIAHGWDLARSQGLDVAFDEDWARGAFHGMSAMGPALEASGQFGPPQPVGDDAPIQQRLIALLGRDPQWSPEA
jgi:uncharacterized protein (TIGR03086 family)